MQITTVVQVRGDHTALLSMMTGFNHACNWLSLVAFQERTFSWLPLQRYAYHELRARFGLTSAQAVVAVRKVAASYKDKRKRATLVSFRELGAIPLYRHSYRSGTVRLYGIEAGFAARPVITLPRNAPQAALIYRDGRFFIQQALEVPEPDKMPVSAYLGCDLGIVNILADSDGELYAGATLNGLRRRHAKLRAKLQSNGTKSAKRLLKKRRRKELRFARDVNHVISKKVVAKAKGTERGIALEDLKGIRERTTVRKAHRRQHHAWSFFQLRSFIEYKAVLAGVEVVAVDPRYTSRVCPQCGTFDKANRKSQAVFLCTSCGFGGLADVLAAGNIAYRAVASRALSDAPYAASAWGG